MKPKKVVKGAIITGKLAIISVVFGFAFAYAIGIFFNQQQVRETMVYKQGVKDGAMSCGKRKT